MESDGTCSNGRELGGRRSIRPWSQIQWVILAHDGYLRALQERQHKFSVQTPNFASHQIITQTSFFDWKSWIIAAASVAWFCLFSIRRGRCRSTDERRNGSIVREQAPSNAIDRMNNSWTFLNFVRERFSNIFEMKDHACYSHRQEEEEGS
jgi:hypothetical protein